jgi:hypothetical protein
MQPRKFCWKQNGESCGRGNVLMLICSRSVITERELANVTKILVELLSH